MCIFKQIFRKSRKAVPILSLFFFAVLCLTFSTGEVIGAYWPQYQCNANRSGYTPEEIHPPYKMAWKHNFLPERPARRTQAIVYQGRVYVGTQQGTMYCFDADNGEIVWKYPDAGSIQHSAGCGEGKVVFTSLDGCVYALDAGTGQEVWKKQTDAGFTVAPLIVDGKVCVGNRRGTFYAFGLDKGEVVWKTDIGEPILNSAAYGDGRVYFGSEAMYMYALDAENGKQLWQSKKLRGMSFKDYSPVFHKGRVFVRPMTSFEANIYAGYSQYGGWPDDLPGGWWAVWTSAPKPLPNFKTRWQAATMERAGQMPRMLTDAQKPVIEHFKNNPSDQDLFILDAKTGEEAQIAPHFRVNSMHGAVTPPVEDYEGKLIMPWVHLNQCWSRYDVESNRLTEFILPPHPTNADENMNVSCGGRYVYIFHCQEGNANHTGIYDLKEKQWHQNPGAGVNWYDNNQSGANPVSIGEGHYYHILFYTLVARTSE